MHICLIQESKTPPDRRVAFTPTQLAQLKHRYPRHRFTIVSNSIRAYTDNEYQHAGIEVLNNAESADLLIGIKEVNPKFLIPGKSYLFFSHTAKKQPHNQKLLQTAAKRGITLIDYEYLTQEGNRIAAFGYWAGIVGAYNALRGYGLQKKIYQLKAAQDCYDFSELKTELHKVIVPRPVNFLITGEGRVASGAVEILELAGIRRLSPDEYLKCVNPATCYTQIGPQHYCKHKAGQAFSFKHFTQHPETYESAFQVYAANSDVLITSHYWNPASPRLFQLKEINQPNFRIQLIADITCDIEGSVPTTLRPSTIAAPYYGVNTNSFQECKPFSSNTVTVMAVDNLPGALPRDASEDFGNKLIQWVFPEILSGKDSKMVEEATLLKKGQLTDRFSYLQNFLTGH